MFAEPLCSIPREGRLFPAKMSDNALPLYRFSLDVPAPVDVVAARLRAVVGERRAFPLFFPNSSRQPFAGAVEDDSFQIWRCIRYRNSFLPRIEGQLASTPGGTRVNVAMSMHPYVLVFTLCWLSFMGYGTWHAEHSEPSPANLIPCGMFVFGLTLSLGAFFTEALKARTLLSSAMLDSRP